MHSLRRQHGLAIKVCILSLMDSPLTQLQLGRLLSVRGGFVGWRLSVRSGHGN
jgi:hypothetical protein